MGSPGDGPGRGAGRSRIGEITFYPGCDANRRSVLDELAVTHIAEAHGKSPTQVLLRWGLQQGRSVIPKSTRRERITENLDVFGFGLTVGELAALDVLVTGRRGGLEPDAVMLTAYGQRSRRHEPPRTGGATRPQCGAGAPQVRPHRSRT
ncbi:aldo/keto reductase [Streptomyces sp. NPDC047000]|uniref:aldo/keto reductase n=1 Tax=Streptomyces sp. NPDC047000 TaxID=3155474 RepID=UPI0033C29D0D